MIVVFGTLVICGVTGSDGIDSKPLPAAFVACTVKVYAVPLAKPDTIVLAELDPGAGGGTVDVMPVEVPLMRAVTV